MVKPLKERIHATLVKRGPASADTIAQRLSVPAKKISPRLSELTDEKRVSVKKRDGEDVYAAKK